MIYPGIRLTPEQIVAAAVAEDVHCVGLSILSGGHAELVPDVLRRLRQAGAADIPVVVGGIIPPADAASLRAQGVAAVFTPEGLRHHRHHRPHRRRDTAGPQTPAVPEPCRPQPDRQSKGDATDMTTATTTPVTATGRLRPRRSCLAVPGSNPRFLEKAQGLPADQVFLDLEDACAPLAKESARHSIVDALNNGDWGGKTRVVRVNDWTTHWTYRDVITVVEGAGPNLDCIMLPKVQDAEQVMALDLLLTQIEKTMGFEVGRIGIEAQIENARGLVNVDEIAAASPRLETIIFGPADFMASINMKSLVVGEQPPGYPADAYHYILMRILMAARAHDLQAIDGPYLQIRNVDGYREVARRAAALGFDGKWVLHPDQIAAANEIFSPVAGGLRPRRADPGRLRLVHLRGRRGQGLGDARRRDDRRGLPQDGPGHLGQGPRRGHAAHLQVRTPGGVSTMQFGRTYEEFEVGAVYKHWPGKTVTEYDDHLFCLLTMNHHPLHLDANYAAKRHRLRPERGGGQLHLLAAARHVGAGRLRQGHRQPGGRVAEARGADLPRRHDLRRDHRAGQVAVKSSATGASCRSRPAATSRTAPWCACSAAR